MANLYPLTHSSSRLGSLGRIPVVALAAVTLSLAGLGTPAAQAAPKKKASAGKAEKPKKSDSKKGKNMEAIFDTSLGKITVKLFPETAPKTVENFVGLATGKKEWTDPKTGKKSSEPLYSGTIFHRVIPGFMIQGGDPLGTGTGGPGYQFADETSAKDSFAKPGILAMANAGPNTNGSQFFITIKPTPWLNGRHTIFGEVTAGMEVVDKIVASPRNENDRPDTPIKINKITVN